MKLLEIPLPLASRTSAVLVLLLALGLLLPSAIRPPAWQWATAHAGLSAVCSAQSPWAGPSSPGVQTPAPLTTPHLRMHSANTWLLLRASCCSRLQDAAGNRLFKDLTLLERFLIRAGLLEDERPQGARLSYFRQGRPRSAAPRLSDQLPADTQPSI